MREGDDLTASRSHTREASSRRPPPAGDHRVEALLGLGDVAGLALLVVEEAARSAREDLEAAIRSVRSLAEQQDAAGRALDALEAAGSGAVGHLREVDHLTEEASRIVAASLLEGEELAGEDTLERLDTWADLSRAHAQRLEQGRNDAWGLAELLDALSDQGRREAVRLQEVMQRRSTVLSSLTGVLEQQSRSARAITKDLVRD
ncbi:MAG: hypothetical protein ACJ72B_09025 [Ornithinibacter sp.]